MATITTRSGKGSPLTNNEVDANFTNLNSDKYESGDSVSVDDLTVAGESIYSSTATTVAAAGSTQGTATALTQTYNIVTTATASSAEGVVLPDAITGKVCTVLNLTAVTVKVYPASSESIDSGATNASKSLPPGASLTFVASSGTVWKSLQSTIVYDSSGTRLN